MEHLVWPLSHYYCRLGQFGGAPHTTSFCCTAPATPFSNLATSKRTCVFRCVCVLLSFGKKGLDLETNICSFQLFSLAWMDTTAFLWVVDMLTERAPSCREALVRCRTAGNGVFDEKTCVQEFKPLNLTLDEHGCHHQVPALSPQTTHTDRFPSL